MEPPAGEKGFGPAPLLQNESPKNDDSKPADDHYGQEEPKSFTERFEHQTVVARV